MNPKHFLLHVVQSQPHTQSKEALADAVVEHVRHALSRGQITRAVREQLASRRRADGLRQHLQALEDELAHTRNAHDMRAERIRQRIAQLRSQLEKQ